MQYSLFDNVGNPNQETLSYYEVVVQTEIALTNDLNLKQRTVAPVVVPEIQIYSDGLGVSIAHNTEDAGQELTYNKRNRVNRVTWDDIKDKNDTLKVLEVTKDKVYPRPDYQKLMGSMNTDVNQAKEVCVHLIKQIYDAIANKPKVRSRPNDEELHQYIYEVNYVMDRAIEFFVDRNRLSSFLSNVARPASSQFRAMKGEKINVSALQGGNRKMLLDYIYNGEWKEYKQSILLIGGNKVLSALQPNSNDLIKALKDIELGWPSTVERWQKMKLAVVNANELTFSHYITPENILYLHARLANGIAQSHRMEADEWQSGGDEQARRESIKSYQTTFENMFDGKYLVVDKISKLLSLHSTEESAIEGARDAVKLKRKTEYKAAGKPVSDVVRIGPEYREGGKNVSTEQLLEQFNLKGVNFGNWMKGDSNSAERQLHLNHAYDSIMDLAFIMDVRPEMMGLNSMIGLAIGAQGAGSSLAHFVPGINEINITRENGAGSLGHEYGHAHDHMLATAYGMQRLDKPYLINHLSLAGQSERLDIELLLNKYVELDDCIRKRQITQQEINEQDDKGRERVNKKVVDWLKAIERDYASAGVDMQKFNDIRESIIKEQYGGERVVVGKNHYYDPVLLELRDLYKQVTGRMYGTNNLDGLQSNLNSVAYRKNAEIESTPIIRRITDSHFLSEAKLLDKDKGGAPYWSTGHEMFARAFEVYIHDKLQEHGRTNTYLTNSDYDNRAYPQGEEREKIVKAMDGVVKEMSHFMHAQHKALSGIALFDYLESIVAIQPDTERGIYKGKVVSITDHYIFQQLGDDKEHVVRHDKTQFYSNPKEHQSIEIRYRDQKAVFLSMEKDKGHPR